MLQLEILVLLDPEYLILSEMKSLPHSKSQFSKEESDLTVQYVGKALSSRIIWNST